MPLEYHKNNTENWDMLIPVLEEHGTWFHDFIEHLFYFSDMPEIQVPQKPTSFAQWVVHANRDKTMQMEIVEKLNALHADLFKMSDMLSAQVKETGRKPGHKQFMSFMTVYEEFMIFVRRLEKDILTEGSGFDSFTGLRHKAMLTTDVKRELDRLARQGKNFCLSLARIDNFVMLQKNTKPDELTAYIKLVADLVKLSIRSFDDAYHMGNGEFTLCLKQTDVTGGISALERLRRELERQKITFRNDDGHEVPLSMSCCIAEPVQGDDVITLLSDLRDDLQTAEELKTDTVLKYHELSPLQRFVKDGGGATTQ